LENESRNLILSVKDHQAIYDASHCEHRTTDYMASLWIKLAQEIGVGKWNIITVISVAVLLFLFYYALC
jgi:hypothetical protein